MKIFAPFFVLFALSIFTLAYWFQTDSYANNEAINITSPLPELLSKSIPDVMGSETQFWVPNVASTIESKEPNPPITARGALSYDLTSGKLLFGKNIKVRYPMASLTKIMTAIVALEKVDYDSEFEVTPSAAEIGENSMGLEAGEIIRLEDLLYGLMLPSGNDAAETIAQGSELGRENFIHMMNKKTEDLGLSNTRFTNPTGLEGDGDQYSTVYDLLIVTRYALQKPEFAKVVATYEHHIPWDAGHKEYYLYNETNLLTTYPGVKGVKTGFTFEAGLCLVTYLEYNGHKIIAVLLNAENRRQEMKDLLDYSLKTLGVRPPPHS